LRGLDYETTIPEGTFYVMARSPIDDDGAFGEMLAEENVLILPGKVVFERARTRAFPRRHALTKSPGKDYPPAAATRTFSVSPPTSSQIFTCLLSRMNRPPMITVITATTIGKIRPA